MQTINYETSSLRKMDRKITCIHITRVVYYANEGNDCYWCARALAHCSQVGRVPTLEAYHFSRQIRNATKLLLFVCAVKRAVIVLRI